jgi:hypothetical protein
MKYSIIEQAVIDEMVDHFSDYVDAKTVVGGESDALFEEMFSEDKKYGILIEFGGGGRPGTDVFKGAIWEWALICVFMIRFTGKRKDIEKELKVIVDVLGGLFLKDHTLGGSSQRVQLGRIDPPDVVEVNNIPMYWLPFEVTAWEKI